MAPVLRRPRAAPAPAPAARTIRVARAAPTPKQEAETPPPPVPEDVRAERAQQEAELRSSGTDYKAVTERYLARVRNPMSAIRARCIQCCNGQVSEVKLCPSETCALHPFRMGMNPFNKKTRERLERETSGDPGSSSEEDDNDE